MSELDQISATKNIYCAYIIEYVNLSSVRNTSHFYDFVTIIFVFVLMTCFTLSF